MELTATILAGGLGTRLRSVVIDRPKVLAQIRGRLFLSYLLAQMAAVDIRQVVICTGYLGKQVREAFGELYGDMRLIYSQESSPLGTAGALRLALPLIGSDPMLVMNGDSYCDADLRLFWKWHRAHAARASILLVERGDVRQFGCVEVNSQGEVTGFQEKTSERHSGWVNAGIYLIDRSLVENIPDGRVFSLEYDMFPAWIGRGLYGCKSGGTVLDIGTPENLAAAEQFFKDEQPGVVGQSVKW